MDELMHDTDDQFFGDYTDYTVIIQWLHSDVTLCVNMKIGII